MKVLSTLLLFLCAPILLISQVAIKTIDATSTSLGTDDYRDFHFEVTNNGLEEASLVVSRVAEDLPNDSWFSTICMEDFCYRADESTTQPAPIPPGMTYKVKFTVYTGADPANATFSLAFYLNGGFNPEELVNFDISSEASSVGFDEQIAVGAALPTPASSLVALTGDFAANAEVELYSAAGSAVTTTIVRATTASISLDLQDLPSGVYFAIIRDNETTTRVPVVVSR